MLAGKRVALVIALIAVLSVACAGPQRQAATTGDDAPRQSRTLRMAVKDEVADLAPKIPGSISPNTTKRLFNATLALTDGAGASRLQRRRDSRDRAFSPGRSGIAAGRREQETR